MGYGIAVVSGVIAFRLVPKVLDPVDVVPFDRKILRMIDAMAVKLRDVEDVVRFVLIVYK